MADFGRYETVQELSRSPFGSVYSARLSGAATAEVDCLIKTLKPADVGVDELARHPDAVAFLERAAVQKQVAQGAPAHWAPIHETGLSPEGAYFVSRYYPSSVQRLIRGRVRLDAKTLHFLVKAAVQGLIDLRSIGHQPHGNLRPANILLGRPQKGGYSEVVLAEPAAAHVAQAVGEPEDLRALGECIYQLVLHRQFNVVGGWPIPDSPEWQRLAPKGRAWREFCNTLLDLAPVRPLSLDAVAEGLKALRVRRRIVTLPRLVAVAVLALVVVATAFTIQYRRWSRNWKDYCAEYVAWFKPFTDDNIFRDRLGTDDYLRQSVVAPLDAARAEKVSFDPRDLADDPTYDPERSDGVPLSFSAARQTARARGVVQKVGAALSPQHWPALVQMALQAKAYRDRGWLAPATYLDQLLGKMDTRSRDGIVAILEVRPTLAKIDDAWAASESLQQKLNGALNDPILSRFGAVAQSGTASSAENADAGDLTTLLNKLMEINKKGAELAAFVQSPELKRIDYARFTKKANVFASAGSVTDKTLDAWLAEIQKPGYLRDTTPDPRKAWSAAPTLDQRQREFQQLTELVAQLGAPADGRDKLKQRLDAARSLLVELDPAKLEWDPDTRPAIEARMKQVDAQLQALAVDIPKAVESANQWKKERDIAQIQDFQKALDLLRQRQFDARSDVLKAAWEKQRDAILNQAQAAGRGSLGDAQKQLDELIKAMEQLRSEFTGALQLPATKPWDIKAAAILQAQAATRREAIFAAAVAKLIGEDHLPHRNKAFEDLWKQQRDQFDTWAGAAARCITGWNTIGDLLDGGYGFAEPADAQGTSIEKLSAQWPQFTADAELQPVLRDLLVRVQELRAMSTSTDRDALVAATASKRLEIARAAWLRLHQPEMNWPATPAELRLDAAARGLLLTAYLQLPASTRQLALKEEVAKAGPESLKRVLTGGRDAASIEQAITTCLAVKDVFGVGERNKLTPRDLDQLQLDGRFRFNLLLFTQKPRIRALAALPDDAARKEVEGLLAALPGFVDPAAAEFKAKLEKLQKDTGGGAATVSAKTGPLASTSMHFSQIAQTDSTVTYLWESAPQSRTLKFVRVEGTLGNVRVAPVYLLSTEVPIGLIADLLRATGKKRTDLGLSDSQLTAGPCGWMPAGKSIAPSRSWLTPQAAIPNPYAPELAGSQPILLKGDGVNPSAEHPMQYLPPESALYAAWLLGCRLPTSSEWKFAAQYQKKQANLRDRTWQMQQRYVHGLRSPFASWPDGGAFVPSGAAGIPAGPAATAWSPSALQSQRIPVPADGSDGALWFRPVDAGEDFSNFIGNVAEFAWDAPAKLEKLPGTDLKALRDVIESNVAQLCVVGGSAISAPELGIDRKPLSTDDLFLARDGYADVGFRLAFDAAALALVDRLKQVVDEQPYLVAAAPARPQP